MILTGDLRQEGGYQLAQICLNGQDPIAICCNNFLMCLGAMKYAQQQGMTIWKDYGMAICEQPPSFYGNSEFIYAGPNLQEIGKSAADLLLERIVHPGKASRVSALSRSGHLCALMHFQFSHKSPLAAKMHVLCSREISFHRIWERSQMPGEHPKFLWNAVWKDLSCLLF